MIIILYEEFNFINTERKVDKSQMQVNGVGIEGILNKSYCK